jgi:hypothetical protein
VYVCARVRVTRGEGVGVLCVTAVTGSRPDTSRHEEAVVFLTATCTEGQRWLSAERLHGR